MRARKTALAILDDLAGRRGIPNDLVHGDDWEQARTKADALVVDALLSERRAVLLRVAGELEALAAMYTGLEAHLLQRQAAKYRKEAK
jgi:hypothetical protein